MEQSLKKYRHILRELYCHQDMVEQSLAFLSRELVKSGTCDPESLTDEYQTILESRTEATLENIANIQDTLRNRYERNRSFVRIAEQELAKTPQEIFNELKERYNKE